MGNEHGVNVGLSVSLRFLDIEFLLVIANIIQAFVTKQRQRFPGISVGTAVSRQKTTETSVLMSNLDKVRVLHNSGNQVNLNRFGFSEWQYYLFSPMYLKTAKWCSFLSPISFEIKSM